MDSRSRFCFPNSECLILAFSLFISLEIQSQPLRVGVAGLKHDHVLGLMSQYQSGKVILLGIAESDRDLVRRYQQRFHLPDSLFYSSVASMLGHIHPDAVLAYNPIAEHLDVVEACAPRGISVMVEKPLATTVAQAERMATLAHQFHIQVLTNYETTWYPSNQAIFRKLHEAESLGEIRKMIVHMGHQGPKEIGCSPDFLAWLTDPVKNGGGAIMDFGCYGANLMTWLMDGRAPVAVRAVTHQIKKNIYPNVDDDATILLEYPAATGIVEASWNWPFGIKDLEVFCQKGYLHALNGSTLLERDSGSYYPVTTDPLKYPDNLSYLSAVLRGEWHDDHDPSSLENNLIVVRILQAARQSAKEGRRISL